MKYMHSEWQRRLDHWLKTLKDDLYLPLGEMETDEERDKMGPYLGILLAPRKDYPSG